MIKTNTINNIGFNLYNIMITLKYIYTFILFLQHICFLIPLQNLYISRFVFGVKDFLQSYV